MAVQEDGPIVAPEAPPSLRESTTVSMLRAMRIYQWSKNLLVLAALVFAKQMFIPGQVACATVAFFAFCFAASATYIVNDLLDVKQDRAHPKKRNRPIASGALSAPAAAALAGFLFAASLALAGALGLRFGGALAAYIVLTLSYSMVLKHVIILDVMALAIGFVVRAMAGAVALDVKFSNWLVVCTLFLALFLVLNKRRHELTLLDAGAAEHRAVLYHYSVNYLDQLILIVAGGALISYTIYTCSSEVVEKFHTDKLYMTVPFVFYGLARYLFLVHHKTGGGDPSRTLITDMPLAFTVALWGTACALVIYV